MRLAIIVPFLNEEGHLGTLLQSVAAQQRPPDRLVLVDDGSSDRSPEMAAAYAAEHPYATLLRRPKRPPERDRMVRAHELKAFEWGLEQISDWDVVAKLDADLRLTPDLFAEIERQFEADPKLGVAGAYLSALDAEGQPRRQRCPPNHVEGENTFYRRACLEAISPLPPILGWDTIDEVRARMAGWHTASFEMPAGDPLHLRRMGSHDGVLRGYRRAGLSAWAYGAHPLHVLAAALSRMKERPLVLCGLHYLTGWAMAGLQRAPRAEPELRRFVRREHLRRLRGRAPVPAGGPRDAARHILVLMEGLPYPFDVRVRAEVHALVEAGYRVTVAGPTGYGCELLDETLGGVRVLRFRAPPGGRGPLGYLREYAIAWLRLARLARRVSRVDRVDLVLVCNPPDTLVAIASLLARTGARVLLDYREISPELFEAKFGRRGPLHRLLLTCERYAFGHSDAVITVSEPCAQIARGRGGVAPERVFHVGNGPDPSRIFDVAPQPGLRRGRDHLVLWLGAMSSQEGLELLIEVADRVVRERRRSDVSFTLVGPGDAHDDLRREVRRRGLEEFVFVSEAVDDDLVRAYLSTADVCVGVDVRNAMNDRAAMRKVLEYMAAGRPVLQFPLGEMRRICGDATAYARDADALDFAEVLCGLLDDPARRARLGEAGRARVHAGMMWPQQVPALLEAVARALDGARPLRTS